MYANAVQTSDLDLANSEGILALDLPNFLVIGAAKAGTSALYALLREHPDIYMSPVKEPRFFSFEGDSLDASRHPVHASTITDIEDYRALFADAGDAIARGEASPSYLHNPRAPGNILKHVPDMKLVAVLRNPAERAYSHFLHIIKEGFETTTDFETAISDPDGLQIGDWTPRRGYLSFGFYAEQLTRYLDTFPADQLHIILYDDFRDNPKAALTKIFDFLGVDADFTPVTRRRYNVSGIPRNRNLYAFLKQPNALRSIIGKLVPQSIRTDIRQRLIQSTLKRPTMSETARRQLIDIYRDDIVILEKILDRSLEHWKTVTPSASSQ